MHAERLVRAGLRVVVVEQTETPDMLRIRNENRPAGQAKVHCYPFLPSHAAQQPDLVSSFLPLQRNVDAA